jgi:hypothetical protein
MILKLFGEQLDNQLFKYREYFTLLLHNQYRLLFFIAMPQSKKNEDYSQRLNMSEG